MYYMQYNRLPVGLLPSNVFGNKDMVHVDVEFGAFPLKLSPLCHLMRNEVESERKKAEREKEIKKG